MDIRTVAMLLALTLLTPGCNLGDGTRDGNPTTPAPTATSARRDPSAPPTPEVSGTVANGLTTPWGLAFLPDRSALVSERDTARIKRVTPDGKVSTIGTVPGVVAGGEGGLLGIAVAADFVTRPYVYAYFTAANDNRIVRMRFDNGRLGPPEVVLKGIRKGVIHNGGRIVFGPDGMLYVGTGETGQRELAQDRASLNGKILRMTPAGRPAAGNPFDGSVVYSYGHRNVQGLAFDSDGRLWASEFGQSTWDELNLIRAGENYGWPIVEGRGDTDDYVNPLVQWGTDEASPSGIAIAAGAVWMAALRGARLWRIPVAGERVERPQAFFTGRYGRLRTIWPAPDGSLWLTTSNTDGRGSPHRGDDRILRLTLSP